MPRLPVPVPGRRQVTVIGIAIAFLAAPLARAAGQDADERLRVLEEHETKDPLLRGAVQRVRAILPSILPKTAASQPQVDLLVVDFGEDWPAVYYTYRTDSCQAIRTGLPRPTIICGAQFLAEV